MEVLRSHRQRLSLSLNRRINFVGIDARSDGCRQKQLEIIVGTWRAARAEQDDVTEDEAREALIQLDPVWDALFPAEQARIVQLMVDRVDVRAHGIEVKLRPNGLAGLVCEVAGNRRAAA